METPIGGHRYLFRFINARGNNQVFILGIDITARKQAEMAIEQACGPAKASEQLKSRILATMSHELRTPLNAIIGFSETLMDQTFGELNKKLLRQTSHILDSGRQLLTLISDILDLSKVEKGKMELELFPVNLSDWLESAMVLIREKTTKHGIALILDCPDDLGELNSPGDERKLKQVMFNLLSNYSRTQQGTGLGLTLTKKLVGLHGGSIRLESKGAGQGSTFKISPYPCRPPRRAQLRPPWEVAKKPYWLSTASPWQESCWITILGTAA